MADLEGLEPSTCRLTAGHSATELQVNKEMVAVIGFEPMASAL